MAELVPTMALYAKFIGKEIPQVLEESYEDTRVDKQRGKAVDDLLHQYVAETRLARYGLPTREISLEPSIPPPIKLPKGIWVYTDGVYEGLFEYVEFRNGRMNNAFVWKNWRSYMHNGPMSSEQILSPTHSKCQKIFDFAVAERKLVGTLQPIFAILPQPVGIKILKHLMP